MDFVQVDVFGDAPFKGNPLAVFPDAARLSSEQMQAIASEMNLSETTFVVGGNRSSYEVRIFTPLDELPFAGHPTLGTAWVLKELGRLEGDRFVQRSHAGETRIDVRGEVLWLTRAATSEADLEEQHPWAREKLARALGLDDHEIGLEAREIGRSGHLRPAFADAGLRQLIVPLATVDALGRSAPLAHLLAELTDTGVYCFTSYQAGRVRARGFWPSLGVPEDPATGSAAAALGAYLAARVGPMELQVLQGVEMGRESRILLDAAPDRARVGGTCRLVFRGRLEALP